MTVFPSNGSQSIPIFLWFRRGIAVLIALVFLPLLVLAVTVSGLRSSLAEPDGLIEALREADFYGYVHDHLAPALLDGLFDETDSRVIRAAEPLKDDVAAALREGFPPAGLQQATESGIRTVWPYLTGQQEQFELRLDIATGGGRSVDALSQRIARGDAALYDAMIALIVDGVMEEADAVPFASGLLSRDDVEEHARAILPREWLLRSVAGAVDDIGAYYTGETENSVITIPLEGRADAVEDALIAILSNADPDGDMLERGVADAIESRLPAIPIAIPGFGPVTADPVSGLIQQAVSESELDRVRAHVIVGVAQYAVGHSDTLVPTDVEVSLIGARDRVSDTISQRTDTYLRGQFETVPVCETGEWENILQSQWTSVTLPPCVLDGIDYDAFLEILDITPGDRISSLIRGLIPLSVSIDEDDIRGAIGPEAAAFIERARKLMTEGITFDVAGFGEAIDLNLLDNAVDARGAIRDGVRIDQDSVDALVEDVFGAEARSTLQTVRRYRALGQVIHIVLWAAALLPLLLAAVVGGQGWEGRLTWASATLGSGAALIWLIATLLPGLALAPVFDSWAASFPESSTSSAGREFVARVDIFVTVLLDGILEDIRTQAIMVGVVAGVGLIIARLLAPASVGRRPAGR